MTWFVDIKRSTFIMVDFVSLDQEIVIDNNNNKFVIEFRLQQHTQ